MNKKEEEKERRKENDFCRKEGVREADFERVCLFENFDH